MRLHNPIKLASITDAWKFEFIEHSVNTFLRRTAFTINHPVPSLLALTNAITVTGHDGLE